MAEKFTYEKAGVSISRGQRAVERIRGLLASTHRPEVEGEVGGFAGAFRLGEETLLVGADGVGSKVLIAEAMATYNTVGIDLVAMNVNDVVAAGGEPLLFLDYIASHRLEPLEVEQLVEGMANGCRQAGCALLGGETAELPDLYQPGHFDLAGFVVGRRRLTMARPAPGDAVIGLASSGFHANGFQLIRTILQHRGLNYHQMYDQTGGRRLGELLLTPTLIYVSAVRALAEVVTIKAMAHITGGGLVENLPRTLGGLGATLVRDAWRQPELMRWVQELGEVVEEEMFRTFNMGIGFTISVAPEEADRALKTLSQSGHEAWLIGRVEQEPGVRFA